jgi:hypothetical protein
VASDSALATWLAAGELLGPVPLELDLQLKLTAGRLGSDQLAVAAALLEEARLAGLPSGRAGGLLDLLLGSPGRPLPAPALLRVGPGTWPGWSGGGSPAA